MFSSISYIDKVLFAKHLSVMIRAGMSILEAISIIKEQSTNPSFKKILLSIEGDINSGKSLHDSVGKYQDVFDPLFINLVKIGEETGNLEKNLEYLAEQMKKNYEFTKKVQGALMYPSLVLSTAVAVGFGLSFFVLPQMVDIFKSLDVVLPLPTRILLGFAQIMKDYGIFIISGFFAFIVLFNILIKTKIVRPTWDYFLLKLPVIGSFLQTVEMAFFCRNLGVMIKSGLPIVTAFDILQLSTENLVYKRSVKKIQEGVEKGKSIEEIIQKSHIGFFPKMASRMIGVGEKSGKLDEVLLYLGDFFEDEVDNQAKNFSVILEPLILFIVGLAVAFIALAIISPIYQFTGSIKR